MKYKKVTRIKILRIFNLSLGGIRTHHLLEWFVYILNIQMLAPRGSRTIGARYTKNQPIENWSQKGSISLKFYTKLLQAHISKAQKFIQVVSLFVHFWDLFAEKLRVKCCWNRPQVDIFVCKPQYRTTDQSISSIHRE